MRGLREIKDAMMDDLIETDLCVIGAGSGGLTVAAGGSTSTRCALEVGRVGQK